MKWLSALSGFLLLGCSTIPAGLQPVTSFEVERYMGRWYEIKRLDCWYANKSTRNM